MTATASDNSTRAVHSFVHFFAVTTQLRLKIPSSDVLWRSNITRQISLFPSNLWCGPQEFNSWEFHLHLHKLILLSPSNL